MSDEVTRKGGKGMRFEAGETDVEDYVIVTCDADDYDPEHCEIWASGIRPHNRLMPGPYRRLIGYTNTFEEAQSVIAAHIAQTEAGVAVGSAKK